MKRTKQKVDPFSELYTKVSRSAVILEISIFILGSVWQTGKPCPFNLFAIQNLIKTTIFKFMALGV